MSAIEASCAGFKDMADGTVRFFFDVEPRHASDALELFRVRGTAAALAALKPGQPVALAALRDGHAAIAAEPKAKLGPLCLEAVRYCEMPEFQEWRRTLGAFDLTPEGAKRSILSTCQIASRKDLDATPSAADQFVSHVRTPFMKYMREKHG